VRLCDAEAVTDAAPPDEVQPDEKDWTWVLERRCDQCGLLVAEVPREQLAERAFVAAEEWVQILLSHPAVEARPEPGVWSALEYGAHVRDVYRVFGERLAAMLDSDDPNFANWDQDETARIERYAEQDPEQVAEELEAAAQRLIAQIERIPAAAWSRTGTRSNGSSFTVTTLLQYFLHDVVHHLWDVTDQQDATESLTLG
jgi:hypothetical protein